MHYVITDQPINTNDVRAKVVRSEAGAIVLFEGIAREFTDGKQTRYLEYEAYEPMAMKQMARIGKEISAQWPEVRMAMTHRIGRLDISDIAIVIAVSAPHRQAAYEASQFAINRVKDMVPIWKKEFWTDGSAWIGSQQGPITSL